MMTAGAVITRNPIFFHGQESKEQAEELFVEFVPDSASTYQQIENACL